MRGQDTSLGGGNAFPQTTWWVASRSAETKDGQAALQTLCERYWKPIYCYVRRAWGKGNEDAKDVTQAFFVWLLESSVIDKFDPSRARFRHYLKGLVRNFVSNYDQATRRQKRGGGRSPLPLDAGAFDVPDSRAKSPEEAFDHAWVDTLIERATEHVRAHCQASGQTLHDQVFEAYDLAPPGQQPTYASVAAQLGILEKDVRNKLAWVRELLRARVREELRETVADAGQLDAEWAELFPA